MLILAPETIKAVGKSKSEDLETPDYDLPELIAIDSVHDHDYDEGDGFFVRRFLSFLQKRVSVETGEEFYFDSNDTLNSDTFKQIFNERNREVALRLLSFTNACYRTYRETMVTMADRDDVESNCRDYCETCTEEDAWTEPEYEGPDPDDEAEYEGVDDPTLTPAEIDARTERNDNRHSELTARRERWLNSHHRSFTCNENCDAFTEHVDNSMDDYNSIDSYALHRAYEFFCNEFHLAPIRKIELKEPKPEHNPITEPLESAEAWGPPLPSIRSLLRRERGWQ